MKSPTEPMAEANRSGCADPLRRLFFDRVGRYFENEGVTARGDGDCAICGAPLTDAVVSSKIAACRAQRSITQNRGRPADDAPLAFGSPVKPGSIKNSLNCLGAVALIAEDTTFVATNVIPAMPLPKKMTAVPVMPGIQTRFFRDFIADPPKPPFLLVMWSQKATCPFEMTHSLSRIAICGTDTPRYIDIEEIRRNLAIVERMGAAEFRKACWLRMRMHRETDAKKIESMNTELRALVAGNTLSIPEFKRLPTTNDLTFMVTMQAAGDEEQGAKEQAAAETEDA